MTEDDKYALKEFLNGVAVTLGVVGFGILIVGALSMNILFAAAVGIAFIVFIASVS